MLEVEKCASLCRYYAEHGPGMLAPRRVKTEAAESYVAYNSLGPILGIMPWNFPYWQVFRFAVPALMAGNVALLKHAPQVPQCAEALEKLFNEAGFPEGVFAHLPIDHQRTAEVIADSRTAAVTLTGSEAAGSAVAALAGQHIKKTILELGGSDPYLVLEDADATAAAVICAKARMINAGQSCIAAKRFIVHHVVWDPFVEAFVEALKKYRYGDPMDATTTQAPMASMAFRDRLRGQVDRAVAAGAEVRYAASPTEQTGAYFPPTVLTSVESSTPSTLRSFLGLWL